MSAELINKLAHAQLQPLLNVYAEWFNLEEHANNVPYRSNAFKYTVEQIDGTWKQFMVFTLDLDGEIHRFSALIAHRECYQLDIKFHNPDAPFYELQNIVGFVAAEIYHQLERWAVANNIPPENLLH